jgi:GST-like protein
MIDLYSWTTPNGRKVHIMLEECGLAHRDHPIDIRKGDQFTPEFLAISPNNKIPAIVDQDGPGGTPYALFESGAILMYLAEKAGKFLPTDGPGRHRAIQWLMFQMGGVGPMFGQANHFLIYAKDKEKHPYSATRYQNEAKRLCGVLDTRLGKTAFVAGDDYTIADMAIWPWCMNPDRRGISYDPYPNLRRWFDRIAARDGVKRGLQVLEGIPRAPLDAKAWEIMFGATQFQRR